MWQALNPFQFTIQSSFFYFRYSLHLGSTYVIVLRPTVGVAPTKHDVISMLPKQY